jgi:hypothetical protein
MVPPGMMMNPAFVQWRQQKAAWDAETHRRKSEFLNACHMVRHDVMTGYKVDIEADSTIAPDEQAEKAARSEFLQAVMPMLQMMIPEVQQNPAIAPLAEALLMFGVRAFPSARSLEPMFEQAFKVLAQAPPQPPPNKGNTKTPMEIQAEAKTAQGDQMVKAAQVRAQQQTAQGDQQIKAAQVQAQQQKNAIDMMKANMDAQGETADRQQESQFRAAELAQQGQEIDQRTQIEQARLAHMASRDIGGLV